MSDSALAPFLEKTTDDSSSSGCCPYLVHSFEPFLCEPKQRGHTCALSHWPCQPDVCQLKHICLPFGALRAPSHGGC